MMKKVYLLIVFFFCLAIQPGLLFAEETAETKIENIQADAQKETEPPPQAPDNLQAVQTPPSAPQTQETEPPPEQAQATDGTMINEEAALAGQPAEESDEFPEEPAGFAQTDVNHGVIADPLEPVNRAFFVFNDKLYFWFYKPVASVYIVVAPEPVRLGVKNFFSNIFFPVRFVNSLFQAKFKGAGNEMGRFLINSTIGLAGFIDIADKKFGIKESDEDFGQTLAFYGVGKGFYIDWPFIGPSSTVDSIGLAGDIMLDPAFYFLDLKQGVTEKSLKTFNNVSLSLDDYENLKNSALDPYIAIRDAYIQYRQNKVRQ